jgi:LysM repeat protein
MKLKEWILGILLSGPLIASAQNNEQVLQYINSYKDLAIEEMQRSGIPASITLAQGIHETQAGTSELVRSSNNHFGIKCKSSWTGQVVYHDDDTRGECFRSYASAADSYRDHSDFLAASPRYAFLFKLNPEDYASWAYGLKRAGYATNPKYPQILIKLIKDYDLEKYSLIALGKLPPEEPVAANTGGGNGRDTLSGFTDGLHQAPAGTDSGYPEGPFSINSAKVVFVKAGVSLLSVSNEYGVPLARLLEFNDMKQEDILASDQLIFLQRKRKTGVTPVHIVQSGESLYSICQSEGIRYESLLELNRMNPGEEPEPGEKIYLQSMSSARPALRNIGYKKPSLPSS